MTQALVCFDNCFSLKGDSLAGPLGFCSEFFGAQECDELSHLGFPSCRNTCSSLMHVDSEVFPAQPQK